MTSIFFMYKRCSKLTFELKCVSPIFYKLHKQLKRQSKMSLDTSKIFNTIGLKRLYSFIFNV